MQKYAGVVLDHIDDQGSLMKQIWPTIEDVPSHVKTAALHLVPEAEPQDFALVARDGDYVIKKWACFDAGTTAISTAYFLAHHNKLPDELAKLSAARLTRACVAYDLEPPADLLKLAGVNFTEEELGGTLPVVDQAPVVKMASDRPSDPSLYAVEIDGQYMYPIASHKNVKTAEAYWLENRREMHPALKRQFAVKLAARADELGMTLDPVIKEAGALTWAPDAQVEQALLQRKLATADENMHVVLDRLGQIQQHEEPEKFASALMAFDIKNGIQRHWGSKVPDPWDSTYGVQKTAEVILNEPGVRISAADIHNLVFQRAGALEDLFSDDIVDKAERDPVAWFKGLPDRLKLVVGRIAQDFARDGSPRIQIQDTVDSSGKARPTKTAAPRSVDDMLRLAMSKVRASV